MPGAPSKQSQPVLGRYELDAAAGELGAGNFGEVWRARDLKLDRVVALKFVPETAGQQLALRHARALAAAPPHPNLVHVYDVQDDALQPGTDASCGVVVMEHVGGEPLSQLLCKEQIAYDLARRLSDGILGGLEHLHEHGLAHGDLHDENVLVVGGSAKLIDVAHDALSLSRLTQKRRRERDLDSAARFISDLLSLAASDGSSFLASCPGRTVEEQRAALANVTKIPADPGIQLAQAWLDMSYSLEQVHKTVSGYCNRHDYLLTVRLRNDGQKTITSWHVDVEVPSALRPRELTYHHEVVQRRSPTTLLLRWSDDSDGIRKLYPGDVADFTVPYTMDDVLNRKGVLSQEFVVRAFVDGLAIAPLRRTVEELTNF